MLVCIGEKSLVSRGGHKQQMGSRGYRLPTICDDVAMTEALAPTKGLPAGIALSAGG